MRPFRYTVVLPDTARILGPGNGVFQESVGDGHILPAIRHVGISNQASPNRLPRDKSARPGFVCYTKESKLSRAIFKNSADSGSITPSIPLGGGPAVPEG